MVEKGVARGSGKYICFKFSKNKLKYILENDFYRKILRRKFFKMG